ncbi:MAG: hypothetical protein A2Y10_00710 [Planctomycetes bacterium GWF2_41_51]|nr:MAG: hypothetical protein A2Y10_00710 [Planctomycetes bacterium GWF2_41_51]HBG25913.1 hypothetical protein [Phycisphaerales bacterium]
MVGTRLKIIVSSDTDEYWWGGSLGFETVPNPGLLTARGPENFGNWEGSCLPAAGTPAGVGPPSYLPEGFDMYPGSPQTISPGDWFVIDYNAMETGECNVAFYNYQIDEYAPLYYLSFSHVPSRDFNEDKIVNFEDYRILLDQWLASCSEPQWCDGADIDTDGFVDVMDLKLFCEFWLEETQ